MVWFGGVAVADGIDDAINDALDALCLRCSSPLLMEADGHHRSLLAVARTQCVYYFDVRLSLIARVLCVASSFQFNEKMFGHVTSKTCAYSW